MSVERLAVQQRGRRRVGPSILHVVPAAGLPLQRPYGFGSTFTVYRNKSDPKHLVQTEFPESVRSHFQIHGCRTNRNSVLRSPRRRQAPPAPVRMPRPKPLAKETILSPEVIDLLLQNQLKPDRQPSCQELQWQRQRQTCLSRGHGVPKVALQLQIERSRTVWNRSISGQVGTQQQAGPISTLRRLSWTSPGKGGAFHHSNCRRRSPWATSHRRRRTNPGSKTSRTVTKSCWPLRRKCQCRQWFLERRASRPHPRKHLWSRQPCCKFSGAALTKSATVCRSQLFFRWSGTSLVVLAA